VAVNSPAIPSAIQEAYRLASEGRTAEARDILQRRLRSSPRDSTLHFCLAGVLMMSGDLVRAEFHYRQAAALSPRDAEFLIGHGVALARTGRGEEAAAVYRRVIALDERSFMGWLGLSSALTSWGDFAGAEDAAARAAAIQPGHPASWTNRAVALTRLGRATESVGTLREGLSHVPGNPLLLIQLAVELNYVSGPTAREIFDAHVTAGRAIERWQGGPGTIPVRDADARRRLRIAYLSPDFRSHSVASFVEPILRGHDRGSFEVACYSGTTMRDGTTERLSALADRWVDVTTLGDDALAGAIRADAPRSPGSFPPRWSSQMTRR